MFAFMEHLRISVGVYSQDWTVVKTKATDAVASRAKLDWKIALPRLAASGAIITTTESVMFEWCAAAGSSEFKQLSRLVKGE